VGNAVFVPAAIAYCWTMLGFVAAGLILYLAFMAGAFKAGLFKNVGGWPRVSQVTLVAGPFMVALGCFFSFLPTSYYMLLPTGMYSLLGIWGWRALAAKFGD
jgi:hypothetical protein